MRERISEKLMHLSDYDYFDDFDADNVDQGLKVEQLKIRYDILKQDVAKQNKILQILLGLVSIFIGVFEITLCICNDATLSWIDIIFNVIALALFIWAIICIILGLCLSNDKPLDIRYYFAKKFWKTIDIVDYYKERILTLVSILAVKKKFVKQAKTPTILLSVCAGIYEIVMLMINIIPLIG